MLSLVVSSLPKTKEELCQMKHTMNKRVSELLLIRTRRHKSVEELKNKMHSLPQPAEFGPSDSSTAEVTGGTSSSSSAAIVAGSHLDITPGELIKSKSEEELESAGVEWKETLRLFDLWCARKVEGGEFVNTGVSGNGRYRVSAECRDRISSASGSASTIKKSASPTGCSPIVSGIVRSPTGKSITDDPIFERACVLSEYIYHAMKNRKLKSSFDERRGGAGTDTPYSPGIDDETELGLKLVSKASEDPIVERVPLFKDWDYEYPFSDDYELVDVVCAGGTQISQYCLLVNRVSSSSETSHKMKKKRHAFVVFRGTVKGKIIDLLSDACGIPFPIVGRVLGAHSGIYSNLKRDFEDIYDKLQQYELEKIYAVGHSLGGGMAQCFVMESLLKDPTLANTPELMCITFGAPTVVCIDKDADQVPSKMTDVHRGMLQKLAECSHHIVNRLDIVPRMPIGKHWIKGLVPYCVQQIVANELIKRIRIKMLLPTIKDSMNGLLSQVRRHADVYGDLFDTYKPIGHYYIFTNADRYYHCSVLDPGKLFLDDDDESDRLRATKSMKHSDVVRDVFTFIPPIKIRDVRTKEAVNIMLRCLDHRVFEHATDIPFRSPRKASAAASAPSLGVPPSTLLLDTDYKLIHKYKTEYDGLHMSEQKKLKLARQEKRKAREARLKAIDPDFVDDFVIIEDTTEQQRSGYLSVKMQTEAWKVLAKCHGMGQYCKLFGLDMDSYTRGFSEDEMKTDVDEFIDDMVSESDHSKSISSQFEIIKQKTLTKTKTLRNLATDMVKKGTDLTRTYTQIGHIEADRTPPPPGIPPDIPTSATRMSFDV